MVKFKFLLWLLFIQGTLLSQEIITGKILDRNTNEPLPYAFIIKKGQDKGAITNEDGVFRLMCDSSDILIVSYVSYQKIEVPSHYFSANYKLYLKPKMNALDAVTVWADLDVDPYLAIINIAKKKILTRKNYQTKSYFTLESHYENQPMELLECYYNAEIYYEGIHSLDLKNGRIGLSEIDRTYFVSLHTTKIISDYKLMSKKENKFPSNPLHYSKSKKKPISLQAFAKKLIITIK